MKPEIEVKVLNVNHDDVRKRLEELGATLVKPMRLMRRSIIDYHDRRLQSTAGTWGWIRVRDEDGKATLTYKQVTDDKNLSTHEIEVEVSSYEDTVLLFKTIGLNVESVQESKRETWRYKGCDVELDEWPWIKPNFEVEGPDEIILREVITDLGFSWDDVIYGGANEAYRREYPKITGSDTIGNIPEIAFGKPIPEWLENRR